MSPARLVESNIMNAFRRKNRNSLMATSGLAELIHIECDAGTTRVFRVCGDRQIGYIHFQAGRIIHAIWQDVFGMKALLAIFSWSDPSFDPCDTAVSTLETISSEELTELLGGGEADMSPGDKDNLIVIPHASNQAEPAAAPSDQGSVLGEDDGGLATMSNCDAAVRLSADGRVMATSGNADDLADLAAYATRLGQLAAEALGMEEIIAIECTSDSEIFLIYEAEGGDIVALKAKDKSPALTAIRAKLDL